MSRIDDGGNVQLESIPPHGTRGLTSEQIAEKLRTLLRAEALAACDGFSEIYLLLSGGLDSRIIAITLRDLYREGLLNVRPVAVTWGLEDSRDVVYARESSRILGFDWKHVSVGPKNLIENIELSACKLGGLNWPTDLHAASWFRQVSPSAIVLAGSEGDAIGRGESASATVLERRSLRPGAAYGLLSADVERIGTQGFYTDLQSLRARISDRPGYAFLECEDQNNRHRGQLIHAMGLIDHYCHVYQMFTHPDLFSFVWSVHPSLRTNDVYAELLRAADPQLARMPWSRTNRALGGKTSGARQRTRREFHRYQEWIRGPLYDELRQRIDPRWFAATGLFRAQGVEQLGEIVRSGGMNLRVAGKRPYSTWLWLAVFRSYAEHIQEMHKTVTTRLDPDSATGASWSAPPVRPVGVVRRTLRQSPFLLNLVRDLRRKKLRRRALREYPIT